MTLIQVYLDSNENKKVEDLQKKLKDEGKDSAKVDAIKFLVNNYNGE